MKPALRFVGRFGIALAAAVTVGMLAGCSPEYNWRQMSGPDQDYLIMLPAKPATMTRKIRLEEMEVSMAMQGAKVNEATFTAAVATLADASQETRNKAVQAMQRGMLTNIAAQSHRAESVSVPIVDSMGARRGSLPATRLRAEGSVKGQPVRMSAGFTAFGARAYQWVLIEPVPKNPQKADEQVKTFIESFRLVHTGASQ